MCYSLDLNFRYIFIPCKLDISNHGEVNIGNHWGCIEMTNLGYFQVLLINLFTAAALKLSCDPGEELKPYTLTCEATGVLSGDDSVTWKKKLFQLALCTPPTCLNLQIPNYTATVSNQISTLTVINVSRQSEEDYSCTISNPNNNWNTGNSTCDFRVYARPESVTCQQPELQNDTVKVVCTVKKIFPTPICQFFGLQNGTKTNFTQVISYQNSSVQGYPEYFFRNCSLTLPIHTLVLGSNQFSIRAYPNVTGQASDTLYGRYSNLTSAVKINYPTVTLESCPGGYVQEGTLNTCTCRETTNTFLPATTNISRGSTILCSGPGYTVCNFIATRNTRELTCQAKVLNYTSVSVKYIPQVAYGPGNVSMKVMFNKMETDVTDWCDKTQPVTMTVNCFVLQNDVSPNATFDFHINGTQVSSDSPVSTNISTTVIYSISSAGPRLVKCTGKNSQFPEKLKASQEKIIYITEPPPTPPIIENYSESGTHVTGIDNQLIVQEGMNKFRCRVEGGYPSVSSVSVECGTKKNASNGNVAIVDVNVNRTMDSSECSCTATHNSSCWNNKAVSKLDVHFEPTIVTFKVNENPVSITTERNSDVYFSCKAEGNPSPNLSLKKDELQLITYHNSTQKFNLTLMFNKTMADCKDAGVYVCQAGTDPTAPNKLVDVYVVCAQQLQNSEIQNKVYLQHVNSIINISIPVFGYPEPDLYLSSEKHDLDKEYYKLAYIKDKPPYGNVSLMIFTISSAVFQNYSLNITNSNGSLIYNFQIAEADPAPLVSENSPGSDVGAIVGGIVAGIVVIVAVVLILIFLKRKGLLNRDVKDINADNSMQTLSLDKQKGSHYENISQESDKGDVAPNSHYENILQESPNEDVPSYPHYEEISDIQSDITDNSSSYTNRGILNTEGGEVEYENTVSAF